MHNTDTQVTVSRHRLLMFTVCRSPKAKIRCCRLHWLNKNVDHGTTYQYEQRNSFFNVSIHRSLYPPKNNCPLGTDLSANQKAGIRVWINKRAGIQPTTRLLLVGVFVSLFALLCVTYLRITIRYTRLIMIHD